MSAAAKPQITRERALEIVNSLEYMVASSHIMLLRPKGARRWIGRNLKYKRADSDGVVSLPYQVFDGKASYTFESQPFRVICEITKEEFLRVFPQGQPDKYHYHIHTD